MPLMLKPLRCPHCQNPMDKRLLNQHGLLKSFLASDPFACPHCQNRIVYPQDADRVLSIGLFIAVILTPLFYFWDVKFIQSTHLFLIGLAITFAGTLTQKLEKAPYRPQ